MGRYLHELPCLWRGFSGANDRACDSPPFRAHVGPWATYKAFLVAGWSLVLDERLEAKDLNPDRPRRMPLCPAHARVWLHFFGPRYALSPGRAVRFIVEWHASKQPTLDLELDVAETGHLHSFAPKRP